MQFCLMAKRPAAAYRSPELEDIDDALDRATFRVAAKAPAEALRKPELKRILVAIDGSSGSRHVLEWAVALAKPLQAHVTVVSVAPPEASRQALASGAIAWPGVVATFGEAEEEARKVLRHADRFLSDAGIRAALEHLRGLAASSIVDLARNEKSDLVILGSHGHGVAERVNLGSVGTGVKHNVPCAVLIARGPPLVRRALLASDGSQRARIAVQVGLDVAKALDVPALLAHVVDARSYGLSKARSLALAKLVQAQLALRKAPENRGLKLLLAHGPPAPRLRKLATENKCDLIVVGSRGLGGLRGLALGSVSDKLTHKADQSVLVVKPQDV